MKSWMPSAVNWTAIAASSTPGDLATIAAGIATIHLIIFLVLRFSTTILRVVREAGVTVISRIAGVLLAAIAVQLTADGIHDFILSWQ